MRDATTDPEIDTTPRWQKILRWILFFPASVVGNIVADSLFFHLSSWNAGLLSYIPTLIPASAINFLQSSLPIICGAAAGGIAQIVIGAAVAPRFRAKVSLVLLVLSTCFFALATSANLVGLRPYSFQEPAVGAVLWFVGAMLGIVGAFYVVVRRVGWESNAPISRLWRSENSME